MRTIGRVAVFLGVCVVWVLLTLWVMAALNLHARVEVL